MNTFDLDKIRERLAQLKTEGTPPTHIARRAGIPQSSMSKFMTGKTALSAESIQKLWPVIFA